MRLEYQGKSLEYNLDGSLKGTIVNLGHLEGGHLPILLLGNKTALGNQELFELALEKHYEENFPNRAENEKFAKFEKAIERANTAAESTEKLSASSRKAFLKVMMKFYEKDMITDAEMEELGLFDED